MNERNLQEMKQELTQTMERLTLRRTETLAKAEERFLRVLAKGHSL